MSRDQSDKHMDEGLGDPTDKPLMKDPAAPPNVLGDGIGASLDAALLTAERRKSGLEKAFPVPWADYTTALGGGLWPGLHMLVGGTGSGKTTFALQCALEGAKAGHPVAYVGLELDASQVAMRLAGEFAGISWSKLWLGKSTDSETDRFNAAADELRELPIYPLSGGPTSWGASNILTIASQLKEKAPDGKPPLLVIDFLQLIGTDASESHGVSLRERIGAAAYQARQAARLHGVAVLVISSTARSNYGLVSGQKRIKNQLSWIDAGFRVSDDRRRFMFSPDLLVGLGKESGEIEFAADSVTTLVKTGLSICSPEKLCIAAVAKLRAGPASWAALRFTYRFQELTASEQKALTNEALGGKADQTPATPTGDSVDLS